MKVGILTFPDVINHGAYLQAYGLAKTIESLNHKVSLIPYKNFKHWLNEYKALLVKKNPALAFSNFLKILKFRSAQKKLNLKKITFLKNKINREHYDTIVVGSDIVWNFISPFLGKDNIYFGHGLNTNRIVSYAPSFGYVENDKEIPDYVVDGLKKFSHISVRDENSKEVVKKAIGKEPQIVLDPTFLYDYYGQEIEPRFENYMLIYAFGLRPEEKTQQHKIVGLLLRQ